VPGARAKSRVRYEQQPAAAHDEINVVGRTVADIQEVKYGTAGGARCKHH